MLELRAQKLAVGLAGKYFANPILRSSVEWASVQEKYLENELTLLDHIVSYTNFFTKQKRDPDLVAIQALAGLGARLPKTFSWSDRKDRLRWTYTFLKTSKIINNEIRTGYYTDPSKINGGDPKDVFRFYLMDGYARWFATTFGMNKFTSQDRELANSVVNALCEATVVAAESDDNEMGLLTVWLMNQKWIEEKWGFSKNLVERANVVYEENKL